MVALFGAELALAASTNQQEPLIYVHVPKTGGQSVIALLDPHFQRNEICPAYFYYNMDTQPKDSLTTYKLLRGHFFYAQVRHLRGKKITIIREPVKRTLSEHRFWLRYNRGPLPNALVRLHFLPPGDPLYVMSNHQCLFLSSYDPRDPTITIEQHLKSAKENLANDFWFVGITEDLDNAMRTLHSKLGWAIPSEIPRRNSTRPTGETYTSEFLEEIRTRNWADVELYEFAKELYTTRYASCVAKGIRSTDRVKHSKIHEPKKVRATHRQAR
jgi:hypothetical protein